MEAVTTRFDGNVEGGAGRVHLSHVAGPANLKFLERSEVEVAGIRVGPLSRIDPFDACRILIADAIGDVASLRARV